MSWVEAKWTVDQILQKIGQAPNNMRSFHAFSISETEIGLEFLEPEDIYVEGTLLCSVGGVMIRMSEEGYPTAPHEGTLVVDNKELGKYQTEEFVVSGLTQGKTYYFSAFPYSVQGIYNLSTSEVNREEAQPLPGETVNVTVTIEDASTFTSAIVTCVDETNPTQTKTATITPEKPMCSFAVPVGDTYHLEYGAVDGYSKPRNTESKVSVSGLTSEYSTTYYNFVATINVKYTQGATVTCRLGDTIYTTDIDTGEYAFTVYEAGTWTIIVTDVERIDTAEVEITTDGQVENVDLVFAKIYGIKRDITNSSPAWTRTGDAVGMTATASVGIVAGSSDFNECMPWKGMVRETLDTGDVMVKIPKFYYRRYKEGNVEHIQIADRAAEGFAIHPLFNHANVEKDCAYIGAYKTSENNKSIPGVLPLVNQTRAAMRTGAKAKGEGWGLIDIAALSAIQMLFLVEYATNDSQKAIGQGYCDAGYNKGALWLGTCDNVPCLTGRPAGMDGRVDVVYRGIEGLWGNVYEWVDGVNFLSGWGYVCNDPSKYKDDTLIDYTKLSSRLASSSSSSGYISQEGVDAEANTHVMLPVAYNGSGSTYYCDYGSISDSSTYCSLYVSGSWTDSSICGLFYAAGSSSSSYHLASIGSRLLYIPS